MDEVAFDLITINLSHDRSIGDGNSIALFELVLD